MLISPEGAIEAYRSELERKQEALFEMRMMDCPETHNNERIQKTISRVKRITEKVCEAERKLRSR